MCLRTTFLTASTSKSRATQRVPAIVALSLLPEVEQQSAETNDAFQTYAATASVTVAAHT